MILEEGNQEIRVLSVAGEWEVFRRKKKVNRFLSVAREFWLLQTFILFFKLCLAMLLSVADVDDFHILSCVLATLISVAELIIYL